MTSFKAECSTTAMAIMPHQDVGKALELALSLDIPFWPQLPKVSLYEDMYIQASQNFPGVAVDLDRERLSFDTARFEQDLEEYFSNLDLPQTFALTDEYSAVYHQFLFRRLQGYKAIRGQVTGPISFGFKVLDEKLKPIIYNDEVRAILFDFIQKKVNLQYHELKEKNPHAFVWLDEPGLGYVFSALSGYNDEQARKDYHDFLCGLEGPRGLHLCADVNLPYLLELGVDILSFDAYQIESMPEEYAESVAQFIQDGGVISWGIVPTESSILASHTPGTLTDLLLGYWEIISDSASLSSKQIARQALIAPARCCLAEAVQTPHPSSTEEMIVERAFAYTKEISRLLKGKYSLD